MSNRPSLYAHANQSNGGIELALSAVAFGALGWWLDRRLGLTPVLLITCGTLGFIGAGLSLYYRYQARIARLRTEAAELRRQATVRSAAPGAGATPTTEGVAAGSRPGDAS